MYLFFHSNCTSVETLGFLIKFLTVLVKLVLSVQMNIH